MNAAGMRHIFRANATALAAGLTAMLVLSGCAGTPHRAEHSASSCSATRVENGCGTLTFSDGSKYVGEFRQGNPAGDGKDIFSDGSTLIWDRMTSRSHTAHVTYIEANGTVLRGPYRHVRPNPSSAPTAAPDMSKYSGRVTLAAVLDRHGNVTAAKIVGTVNASPGLKNAAIQFIKSRNLGHAEINGTPIDTLIFLRYQFPSKH